MALGGGVFVTQNKTLPGSYINFVNASTASATVGERGTVAVVLSLGVNPGKVIELTQSEFIQNGIGEYAYGNDEVKALREIFRHATKVYVYDLESDASVSNALVALEAYDFNVLCAYTDDSTEIAAYIAQVKTWRDDYGKKCQVVVYNQTTSPNHEGVINVMSHVSDEGAVPYALVAWVAGAQAGCAINESCTNLLYDGEYNIVANRSQSELGECIAHGQFVFHNVYGEMRVLEDINSLTTTTTDKGDDFKYNQTIRIIDQIANDIAKIFNTKYLGRIPNDASGRVSLWADIVAHHRQLAEIQAIENFESDHVKVEQGNTKKSVIVTDVITVVNAMSQLYMTVIVQ